jgi:hypothetical protein
MTSPLYQEGAVRKFIGIGLTVVFAPFKAVSAISGVGTVAFFLARLPDS